MNHEAGSGRGAVARSTCGEVQCQRARLTAELAVRTNCQRSSPQSKTGGHRCGACRNRTCDLLRVERADGAVRGCVPGNRDSLTGHPHSCDIGSLAASSGVFLPSRQVRPRSQNLPVRPDPRAPFLHDSCTGNTTVCLHPLAARCRAHSQRPRPCELEAGSRSNSRCPDRGPVQPSPPLSSPRRPPRWGRVPARARCGCRPCRGDSRADR